MTGGERTGKAWRALVRAGVALAVVGSATIVLLLATGDRTDDPELDVTSTSEPPATTTTTSVAALVDEFERGDAEELGATPAGAEWEAVLGSWGIREGAAVVLEPNQEGPRSIAIVDTGGSDGTIRVTFDTVADGGGIAFRYRGQYNYWMVTARPEDGGWIVTRIADARASIPVPLVPTPTGPGTQVEILLDGPVIEVSFDGELVFATTDPSMQFASKAGLVLVGHDTGTAWDSFEADTFRAQPILGTGDEADPDTP